MFTNPSNQSSFLILDKKERPQLAELIIFHENMYKNTLNNKNHLQKWGP